MEAENKIPDSEILAQLLDELKVKGPAFSNTVGVHRNTVYGILRSQQKITRSLIDKIKAAYPNVNAEFLSKGEGAILKEGLTENLSIPQRLVAMENKLDLIIKLLTN